MNKLFTLLFTSIITLYAFSQVYIGPLGGYHTSIIANQNNYGDSELGYKPDFGIEVGGMIGYQFNGTSGVQLNVLYSQLGQKYKDELFDGTAEKEVDLNYVQIPILFEWLPFEYNHSAYSQKPIIYLLIGPQISYLNTTEYTYTKRNGQNVGLPSGANSSDQLFNDLDIGVVIEPGVHLYFNRNIFLKAGVRATGGATDINADRFHIPNPEGNYGASRNASVGLNIGVGILLSD